MAGSLNQTIESQRQSRLDLDLNMNKHLLSIFLHELAYIVHKILHGIKLTNIQKFKLAIELKTRTYCLIAQFAKKKQ